MRKTFIGAIATLSLCGPVSQASASTVTYTGTVIEDNETNILGQANSYNVFIGDTITIAFTGVNTANGTTVTQPGYIDTKGGSNFGDTSPIGNVTVSIGSQSYTFSSPTSGELTNYSPIFQGSQGNGQQYAYALDSAYAPGQYDVYSDASVAALGPNVPMNGDFTGANNGDFVVSIYYYNNQTSFYQDGYIYGDITGVATVAATSGVPETSTWIMMLSGFTAMGFAGYRKSRKEAASFAA